MKNRLDALESLILKAREGRARGFKQVTREDRVLNQTYTSDAVMRNLGIESQWDWTRSH